MITIQQWCSVCRSKPADHQLEVPDGEVFPAGVWFVCSECLKKIEGDN